MNYHVILFIKKNNNVTKCHENILNNHIYKKEIWFFDWNYIFYNGWLNKEDDECMGFSIILVVITVVYQWQPH